MIEPKKEQSKRFLYNKAIILRQCQKNTKREKVLEPQLHVRSIEWKEAGRKSE